MRSSTAEDLVRELQKQADAYSFDTSNFMNDLITGNLSNGRELDQEEDSPSLFKYISLRRILNNEEIKPLKQSMWGKSLANISKRFGSYSSDQLVNDLRSTPKLRTIIRLSNGEYSLLGKVETNIVRYDLDGNPRLFIVKKPLLIIPGVNVEERDLINEWENQNTTYEKEKGLFRTLKRISAQEYLAS